MDTLNWGIWVEKQEVDPTELIMNTTTTEETNMAEVIMNTTTTEEPNLAKVIMITIITEETNMAEVTSITIGEVKLPEEKIMGTITVRR